MGNSNDSAISSMGNSKKKKKKKSKKWINTTVKLITLYSNNIDGNWSVTYINWQ
jgi:hypothetical protein